MNYSLKSKIIYDLHHIFILFAVQSIIQAALLVCSLTPFTGVTKMFKLMSGVNVVKLKSTQTQAQSLCIILDPWMNFSQLCQMARRL